MPSPTIRDDGRAASLEEKTEATSSYLRKPLRDEADVRAARGKKVWAEYRLAVAYQVIGSLLDHIGAHDSEWGQKLLDYFDGDEDAPDPLPFSVPVVDVWRSIDTAPKDGTKILVTRVPCTGRTPYNLAWCHKDNERRPGWRIAMNKFIRYEPTHWMPLPEPPHKTKCQQCGAMAVWEYAPSDGRGEYCDECVPRGCSCNRQFNPETENWDGPEHADERGRPLPCIEYDFWEGGFYSSSQAERGEGGSPESLSTPGSMK